MTNHFWRLSVITLLKRKTIDENKLNTSKPNIRIDSKYVILYVPILYSINNTHRKTE